MKARILLLVILIVLLCIPTLGSATAKQVAGPFIGNSWNDKWVTYLVGNMSSDGWEVVILTLGIYFESANVYAEPSVPNKYLYTPSFSPNFDPQTALFSGPNTFYQDETITFWLAYTNATGTLTPETPFEMDFYQLYGTTRLYGGDSAHCYWDGVSWTYVEIPQPVPEPAIIPLLVLSLTCIAGLRRCWKD